MFPEKDLQNVDKDAYFASQENLSTTGLYLFVIILVLVLLIYAAIYLSNRDKSIEASQPGQATQGKGFIDTFMGYLGIDKEKGLIFLIRTLYVLSIFIFFIIPAILMSFTARKNYANYMASRKYSAIEDKSS